MAIVHKSRVKETADNKPNASTEFEISGTTSTGYQSISSAFSSASRLSYYATNGVDWESGVGIYAAGAPDELVRDVVLESSNSDSKVDFSSGDDVTLINTNTAYLTNTGAVHVESSAAQQAIPTGTFTKVASALSTEVVDEMGWWDHANSKFQPDVEGWYLVGGLISLVGISDGKFLILAIYKNGVEEAFLGRQTCSVSTTVTNAIAGMMPVHLNGTTDYIELYIYHTHGTDRNTEGFDTRNNFRAYRIGG